MQRNRRLSLNREALRVLAPAVLGGARGGTNSTHVPEGPTADPLMCPAIEVTAGCLPTTEPILEER